MIYDDCFLSEHPARSDDKLSIDEDGNINVETSPSPDRFNMPDEKLQDESTFPAKHFFLSHLLSFDAQKNTLT